MAVYTFPSNSLPLAPTNEPARAPPAATPAKTPAPRPPVPSTNAPAVTAPMAPTAPAPAPRATHFASISSKTPPQNLASLSEIGLFSSPDSSTFTLQILNMRFTQ